MSFCNSDTLIIGSPEICLDGHSLGCTTGGVNIRQVNEYADVKCDQSQFLISRARTSQMFEIETTFKSLGLDFLRVLFGSQREELDDGFCFTSGANGCSIQEEFDMAIRTPGPGCGCRMWYFPRVILTPDQVEYVVTTEAFTEVTVTFTALATCDETDTDTPVVIGCIRDSVSCIGRPIYTGVSIGGDLGEANATCEPTPIPGYVPN